MKDCIFCEIIKGNKEERDVVYEDDFVMAFPDKYPVIQGHTLVVPKQHYKDIFEIPEDILTRIITVSKMLAEKMKKDLGATGVNVMNANGKDAHQSVFHLHFHVVPRHPDDGLDLNFHSRKRE
jgi:histidine triad (HIT) family protein